MDIISKYVHQQIALQATISIWQLLLVVLIQMV